MSDFHGEIGRLNGVHAEPGTILGPDMTNQWYVVQEDDAEGCTVRFATTHDFDAAPVETASFLSLPVTTGEPRSVTEARGFDR